VLHPEYDFNTMIDNGHEPRFAIARGEKHGCRNNPSYRRSGQNVSIIKDDTVTPNDMERTFEGRTLLLVVP
jgi:hypothetical protein